MKKIIEKQNKKPIIGVWGNKEGGKIGNKKMKSTKIVKEEIIEVVIYGWHQIIII